MKTENKTDVGLKKLHFATTINAPKNKVWDIMWEDESYKSWTSVFCEGSHAISDWNTGSSILFLDGKNDGMYSIIENKIPGEQISFRHIGEIKNGIEEPVNDKTKDWSGGLEKYTLKESGGFTVLNVELDIVENFLEYFNETFPKALQKLKELAEDKISISIETLVDVPIEKAWLVWTLPEHITKWNNASDDWHTPHADNDLKTGGKFSSRMEAKDGSMGFDFSGIYDEVKINERIAYSLNDGRKVQIIFQGMGNKTKISETFEAETENTIELQKGGWQAILNNFKKYTESI